VEALRSLRCGLFAVVVFVVAAAAFVVVAAVSDGEHFDVSLIQQRTSRQSSKGVETVHADAVADEAAGDVVDVVVAAAGVIGEVGAAAAVVADCSAVGVERVDADESFEEQE
jgi:hypothetical protein